MISRANWFLLIIFSSAVLLFSGFVYDYLVGQSACIICWLQRFMLLLLICFALIGYTTGKYIGIKIVGLIGLMLNLRHFYVVTSPVEVTSCVPLGMIMDMPIGHMLRQFVHWLSKLGRDCATEVDAVTYVLIAVLMLYYIWILGSYRLARLSDKIREEIGDMFERRRNR